MSELVSIIFITNYQNYNMGERAGFPKEQCKKLIELGAAKYWKVPESVEVKKPVEVKKKYFSKKNRKQE